MGMPSNIRRAEKVIHSMTPGFWADVRSLAKSAKVSVRTMSRFLIVAKKRGLVENKRVSIDGYAKLHLWKRASQTHSTSARLN